MLSGPTLMPVFGTHPNNGNTKPSHHGNTKPPNEGNTKPPNEGNTKPPNDGNPKPPNDVNTKPTDNGTTNPPSSGTTNPPASGSSGAAVAASGSTGSAGSATAVAASGSTRSAGSAAAGSSGPSQSQTQIEAAMAFQRKAATGATVQAAATVTPRQTKRSDDDDLTALRAAALAYQKQAKSDSLIEGLKARPQVADLGIKADEKAGDARPSDRLSAQKADEKATARSVYDSAANYNAAPAGADAKVQDNAGLSGGLRLERRV